MNSILLKIVNSLLFLSVMTQLVSGFLLRTHPAFVTIHLRNPFILMGLLFCHLWLNRQWIIKTLLHKSSS